MHKYVCMCVHVCERELEKIELWLLEDFIYDLDHTLPNRTKFILKM